MPMNLGLGLGLSRRAVSGAAPAFTPASLFTGGVGGVWWQAEKSDLWQDVARTTPVTAPGDPIRAVRGYTSSGEVFFTRPDATGLPIYRENANGRGYIEGAGTGAGSTDGLKLATSNFAAPAELYWYGSSTGNSGAGPAGFGIEYASFPRRLGTLAATAWLAGIPDTVGRYSLTAVGNLTTLAAYGVRCTAAPFAEAVRDNVVLSSGTPTNPLNHTGAGTIRIAGEYPANVYGGVYITRELTSVERANLQDWFVALANP